MAKHTHFLIRESRKSSGMSQAELARRAGIPRSVMNVYEKGKREPSVEMFARLLNAAGFRLAIEPLTAPVDVARAAEILELVVDLAESLPYTPKQSNNYPPLWRALGGRS
ncbi:MAG: helix-turn-helix transcriptional regulator [Thermoleophilaceae bacterium]|nr:helix-turn-helix transcriptional regulator [Thermoleophilaceae bacterium]